MKYIIIIFIYENQRNIITKINKKTDLEIQLEIQFKEKKRMLFLFMTSLNNYGGS